MTQQTRISITIHAALAIILAAGTGFRGAAMNGEKIIEESEERHGLTSEIAIIKMVVLDNQGNVDTREVLRAFHTGKDGSDYSLLRFRSPEPVKGVALLSVLKKGSEDLQYLYMPALGNIRKISGSSKKGYFMGTDFAYEDLHPEDTSRYKYSRELDDSVDGVDCYLVTARPIDGKIENESSYAKRQLWISKADLRILRIDFYRTENQLLKTLRSTEFRSVSEGGAAERPVRMEMTHHANKTSSMFVVTKGIYDAELAEAFFSVESLKDWPADSEKDIFGALQ